MIIFLEKLCTSDFTVIFSRALGGTASGLSPLQIFCRTVFRIRYGLFFSRLEHDKSCK